MQKRDPPRFFGKDSFLGIATAAVMGLQHALAMVGGLTTVPYLIGSNAFNDPTLDKEQATDIQQYLISASLVVCGIMSMIQVTGIPLPFNRQWGSGILSVMGVSFTTFSIADSTIKQLMTSGETFSDAYGKVLGTCALCGITPIIISFLPHQFIKRVRERPGAQSRRARALHGDPPPLPDPSPPPDTHSSSRPLCAV